jgi:hypothetical protein
MKEKARLGQIVNRHSLEELRKELEYKQRKLEDVRVRLRQSEE